MPKIKIEKLKREIQVAKGANLMQVLLEAGLPVASSCHGDAVCGKCKIKIDHGADQLSPINTFEEILHRRLKIPKDHRISCQTEVFGDIEISTTYW